MPLFSFIVFLFLVISAYGLLNFYFIKKHQGILSGRDFIGAFFKLVLVILVCAPIFTIIFNYHEVPYLTPAFGFISYSWLAFLFLFLSINFFLDLLFFALEKSGIFYHQKVSAFILATSTSACLAILIYGSFEASSISIREIELKTDKRPKKKDGYKIALISDVHFSSIRGNDFALKLAGSINKIKPDILISLGDLVDRGVKERDRIIETLKSIKAPLGKFAIMGNHEYYFGLEDSLFFVTEAGMVPLVNRSETVDDSLNLIGVEDITAVRAGISSEISPKKLFDDVDLKKYSILLKHQPRVDLDLVEYFDLQLSGHTHGGQIFPFSLLVRLIFKYVSGLYELDPKTKIYVSNGTGTWGPPFRFLAPPEITVIKIGPQNSH